MPTMLCWEAKRWIAWRRRFLRFFYRLNCSSQFGGRNNCFLKSRLWWHFFGRFAFCFAQAFGILQRYWDISVFQLVSVFLNQNPMVITGKYQIWSELSAPNPCLQIGQSPFQRYLYSTFWTPGHWFQCVTCILAWATPKHAFQNFRSLVERSTCVFAFGSMFHRHRHGTFCNTSLVPPRTRTTSKTSWDPTKPFSKRSSIDLTEEGFGDLGWRGGGVFWWGFFGDGILGTSCFWGRLIWNNLLEDVFT